MKPYLLSLCIWGSQLRIFGNVQLDHTIAGLEGRRRQNRRILVPLFGRSVVSPPVSAFSDSHPCRGSMTVHCLRKRNREFAMVASSCSHNRQCRGTMTNRPSKSIWLSLGFREIFLNNRGSSPQSIHKKSRVRTKMELTHKPSVE